MKIGLILIGMTIGYVINNLIESGYTLHGGAFTSSPLANIYGYSDNNFGCQYIAACLNYAQKHEMLTEKFLIEWGNAGNQFCVK